MLSKQRNRLRNRLPRRCPIVTMREVAERAGVSVTTVSHVINNSRPVKPQTRDRVEEAMQALGYQPNVLARSLRRGVTHTIGIILPDSANPYFAEVVRGIEDTSFNQGYSVILCNSDNNLDKEHHYTNVLVEKQVDGIIFVAAGLSSENINSLQDRGVPVVLVDRRVPEVQVDNVLADNQGGGWLATSHLIELNHRIIGCIAGPKGVRLSRERIDGFHQALDTAGISLDPSRIVEGDFQYQSGYEGAKKLFNQTPSPTAIFACNDLMAIGAYRFAHENDLKVPGQLSIVGFDDVRLAAYTNPPLTTIHQLKHEMGSRSAELLMERIADQELKPRQVMLDTKLVIRGSTTSLQVPEEEIA
jgi:LacI family transcriptional regulator